VCDEDANGAPRVDRRTSAAEGHEELARKRNPLSANSRPAAHADNWQPAEIQT